MKRIFIVALFVLGMCNVSVFGMVQEITLSELYSIMPLDDAKEETLGERPNPNRFHASIDGNHLSVGADTDAPAYVEVINQAGSYVVQIYSSNIVMQGEFEVE